MKKVLATILIVGFMLSLISSPPLVVSAEIRPYVYEPTVPDTAFAIIALYKMGDYDKVLEGCEWLMAIRTPFDSWGYAYGEDHEAKYTAMAIMALIRGGEHSKRPLQRRYQQRRLLAHIQAEG